MNAYEDQEDQPDICHEAHILLSAQRIPKKRAHQSSALGATQPENSYLRRNLPDCRSMQKLEGLFLVSYSPDCLD